MHWIDWCILFGTILFVSLYGYLKTRGTQSESSYLAANRSTPWWAIGLSIMATQASAITFISTPGLGYDLGLEFAQFYFGLPIAMIIIAVGFVPLYHKLKVYTAYEFLEQRFDLKTRLLTAFLFLVQRGLAAGITIYAPSIILSELLQLPLQINIIVIGLLVILYTVSGGTKAVTQTHKQQMAIIFLGLFVAFGFLLYYIQPNLNFEQIKTVANAGGRLDALDWEFNLNDKYNVWSGIIAGTFLMLSYFGTDQSQVQRYLSGKSIKEIRTGLYFNAVLKIPLQFFILLIGVLVFVFYQIEQPPTHFDSAAVEYVEQSGSAGAFKTLQQAQSEHHAYTKNLILNDFDTYKAQQQNLEAKRLEINASIDEVIKASGYDPVVEKQSDFVFIRYVLDYLPIGLIGLLMAVIFSAAMSSTAAELNALGTTTVVDFYKRLRPKEKQQDIVKISKWITAGWGLVAIGFALVAQFLDSLVEAVNILGSLFYGTVLGIFLCAFYLKYIKGRAVFIAAILSEALVLALYLNSDWVNTVLNTAKPIGFLWYNVIGAVGVVLFALIIQLFGKPTSKGMLDSPDVLSA